MNIKKVLNKKVIWSVVFVIIALVLIVSFSSHNNGKLDIFEVKRSDFVEITEVSGKVVPGEEINLSFEAAGRITSLNFEIGQRVTRGTILARLDSSEISSEINEAIANLRNEEARLDEISGNVSDQNKLESVRNSLISTLKKSYISADSILKNTVDIFITDPQTRSPEFSTTLVNYFLRKDIEEKRYAAGLVLEDWKNSLDDYSADTVSLGDAMDAVNSLKSIEDLLYTISLGTDDFDPNSLKTQAQIDAYIGSISSARTTISALIVDINAATENLRSVEAEVPILQTSINGANATVSKLSAKSNNYIIIAPFDGVITSDDAEVGQVVSVGETVVSMVSDAAYEVESFVPEVSIAGVDVNDNVHLVFDAFGPDEIYEGFIAQIDPRETIKDGITTYRILIGFKEDNEEVLSGMNVEIEIEKERIPNQIIIPRYLISSDNEGSYVEKVTNSDDVERVSVVVGKKDNSGNAIIVSGVSEGDKLVVPISE